MAQRLIIKWKNEPGMLPPYREKFFCKNEKAAKQILERRNKKYIESAVLLHNKELINMA